MRPRVAVFGTLGVLATVAGVLFAFAPGLVLGVAPVRETASSLASNGPKAVMTAAAAIVGLYALASVRSPGGTPPLQSLSEAERRFEAAATDPPEAVTADRRTTTAAALDVDVQVALEDGGLVLRSLRDLLREHAVGAYAAGAGTTPARARQAVQAGTWTADPVAAAFLSGADGPTASLGSRLRLWLAPARERRRRVDATLREIRRLRGER